ncbi:bifunctional riboflavin kinase/FAD synthetase [Bacillus velezensis]|uniref:hypothetical protein n=1 Tax=Bacillus amyloliquefaciens group TaxID=1938374 RepID=UPI0007A5E79E|nr:MULTISPECIES: hypothetical protein [Bacillus amyloliquefaciens group]MEA1005266.1 bifunctional riboflavin kinase/FAD synthetase [Bacillus velezensis]
MKVIELKMPSSPKKNVHQPCVMALGFFDGVHLGHKQLLHQARALASKKGLAFAVMTFDRHPSQIITPHKAIRRYLTPLPEKIEAFAAEGADTVYVIRFNQAFADISPYQFIERFIYGLSCRQVVTGFDFSFGKGGTGNTDTLREASKGKYDLTIVPKQTFQMNKISSSKIRELLISGSVMHIPEFLGCFYQINCTILASQKCGEINQLILMPRYANYFLPQEGMYRVRMSQENESIEGWCKVKKGSSILRVNGCGNHTFSLGQSASLQWIEQICEETTVGLKGAYL